MFNIEKMDDPNYRLKNIKLCIWILVIVGILATGFNIYMKEHISGITTGIIYFICIFLSYLSYVSVKIGMRK